MGHLGNPIAFRLVYEKRWKFNFFVKNKYYPELINCFINIRDYIYYFFSTKAMVLAGMMYSHCLINQILKKLYVQLYIHHVKFENFTYDTFNGFYVQYYNYYNDIRLSKNKKFYFIFRDLSNPDIYVFFYIFYYFYSVSGSRELNSTFKNNEVFDVIKKQIKRYGTPMPLYKQKMLEKNNKRKNFNIANYDLKSKNVKKKIISKKNYFLELIYKKLKPVLVNSMKMYWNIKTELGKLKNKDDIDLNEPSPRLLLFLKTFKIEDNVEFLDYCINNDGIFIYLFQYYLNELKKKEDSQNYANYTYFYKYICTDDNNVAIKSYLYSQYINFLKEKYKVEIVSDLKELFQDTALLQQPLSILSEPQTHEINNKSTKAKKFEEHALNLKDTYFDKSFKFSSCKGIKFMILLLYLAKKAGFKKYKNSKSLVNTWDVMYYYINLFITTNMVSKKDLSYMKEFLFFFNTFIFASKHKYNRNTKFNYRNTLYKVYYHCVFKRDFYDAYKRAAEYLKGIIYYICKIFKCKDIVVSYYFITNISITSQIIANYISERLKNGYPIRTLLDPLRSELKRLASINFNTQVPHVVVPFKILRENKIQFIQKFLRQFINFIIYFNNKISYSKYTESYTFVYFAIFLKNKFNIENEVDEKVKYKRKRRNWFKVIQLGYNYMDFLHNSCVTIKSDEYVNLFGDNNVELYECIKKTQKPNIWEDEEDLPLHYFNFYENNIQDILYPVICNFDKNFWKHNITLEFNKFYMQESFVTTLNLLNNSFVDKFKKVVNMNLYYMDNFFCNNYISYNYIKWLWLRYKQLNKRDIRRQYKPIIKTPLQGYKIVIKGRFSRKDRASKLTYVAGKIPLNTISANIEYTFNTVVLINSIASIKVYLYKRKIKDQYKLILHF